QIMTGGTMITEAAESNFYDFKVTGNDGTPQDLKAYHGKVVLVVNTASQCGYTPQYKGLQAIHEKFQSKGVAVLGFPSNDFGAQEPGGDSEIKKFCELKYRVTFPLFHKNPVSGMQKQPVYQYLVEHSPQSDAGEVKWNFEKFLIGKNGQVVARFRSKVEP